MFSILDQAIAATLMAVRQPVESFIQLETADDDVTLVASDGSLVSYIKMFGSRQIIGDTEYQQIVDQATLKLGSRFDRPGYAMQVYFMRDPSQVTREIDRVMRGNRSAARASELNLEDLLNERRRHLSRYTAHEDIYLVLLDASVSTDAQRIEKSYQAAWREKMGGSADNAQFPMQALGSPAHTA